MSWGRFNGRRATGGGALNSDALRARHAARATRPVAVDMVGRSVATVSEVLWTLLINKNPRREPLATHVQQGCISCCEHRSLWCAHHKFGGRCHRIIKTHRSACFSSSQPRTHITRSALSCRWRPGCLPKGERGVSTCPGSFSGSSSLVSTRCVASSTCLCCWAGVSSCQSAARPVYAPVVCVCVCVCAPMGAASSLVSLHRVDERNTHTRCCVQSTRTMAHAMPPSVVARLRAMPGNKVRW